MARIHTLRRLVRPVDEIEDRRLGGLSARAAAALALGAWGEAPTSYLSPERDLTTPIATGPSVDLDTIGPVFGDTGFAVSRSPAVRSTLPEVEDGRLFNPAGKPRRTVRGQPARLVVPTRARSSSSAPQVVGYKVPTWVALCVRRRARRQVLLAKGHGGGGHRPPRRRPSSQYWC